MTIMSQDKRDLLDSLETVKEFRTHKSYQEKPYKEPSALSSLFTALIGGIIGVFVAPFVFAIFIILIGFAINYGIKAVSFSTNYLFSFFHSL